MLQIRIPVSNSTILALNSSPKLVIPAPGAGKAIQIQGVTCSLIYAAPGFTAPGNLNLYIGPVVNAHKPWQALSAGFLALFGNVTSSNTIALSAVDSNTNDLDNQPVYLFSETADPTGGGGTLVLDICYAIVALV